MDIERREGESLFHYHRRLVYGKLVDKTLADADYSELAERIYGQAYASDVARRMMYGSRKTLELLDEERASGAAGDNGGFLGEVEEKTIELKKERLKLADQRAAFNKLVRERARQEEINEILLGAIREGNLPELRYERGAAREGDSDLLVSLNDLHYGATHTNYWGHYDPDVCAGMMRRYLDRVIEVGERHGSENCVIWENGDAISGSIHKSIQVTNKENVVRQIMGASELISQFVSELSRHFSRVRFVSVAGNHSRLEAKKDDALRDERLDDLVEWYLAARLQNFENVEVGAGEKIDPSMYIVKVRGLNYLGVHGDIDTSGAGIQSLQTMAGVPIYAILLGHKHHNRLDEVQGIKTVMAGSFLGMDDYCVTRRIYGRPEQLICVCDESGIVCSYDVPLA